MATKNDPADSAQDADTELTDIKKGETDVADDPPPPPGAPSAVSQPPVASGSTPSNLADLSAHLREAAAEIAEIAAQAGRLGIAIDAAKALREGTVPEALRKLVLQRAAAAADARDIVAAPPSPILPKSADSPIVAAARKAAAGAKV